MKGVHPILIAYLHVRGVPDKRGTEFSGHGMAAGGRETQ